MKKQNSSELSIEETLLKGEKIVVQGAIHVGIFWKAAFVLLIGVLVALLLVLEIGLLLVFTAALMGAHAFLMKKILLLVVTNKRVLVRYGILQVDVVDIHFEKIESLELERMVPGYIMGYANVIIMGMGRRFISIPYVENALAIRRAYNKLTLENDEDEKRPDSE